MVKIPRIGPVVIPLILSINSKTVPSLSTTKINSTLMIPKTTVMIFIRVLAFSSDVSLGIKGATKSLYTIPESAFRHVDNVLKSKQD